MRNALQIISSLDAGSKNRLDRFRSELMRCYDRRNFDHHVANLLCQYAKPNSAKVIKSTMRYLRDLRSSKDGHLFSQGVKDYGKLLEGGKRFAEPNHTYFGWNGNYKAAKEALMKEFRSLSLKPIRYQTDDDIVETLPKLDTHAGFTFILTGKKEKGENLEQIWKRWNVELNSALAEGTFGKPILPAVRTQGSGHAFDEEGNPTGDCDHKTRMVSMVDLSVIITELMFARPIQDYLAECHWYAGGKNVDTTLASIIIGLRSKYHHWVSLDYSSFDQSISAWLIHDAFSIMREAFKDLSEKEELVYRLVEHDFIEKDFVFGEEVIHSVKGVPSGSMFTQIVDSIVNRLVIQTYLNATHNEGDCCIMGDDNILYTYREIDRESLASYVSKNFGMEINPIKTKCGKYYDHPTFLSCEWWPEGRYREPHEVIAKMLYPERARVYGVLRGKPEEVLWSYVLMYRITMERLIDVERFLSDYPRLNKVMLKDMDSRIMPGFLKYVTQYTGGYWSLKRKADTRRRVA